MIKVNEYFGGRVKSLSLNTSKGPATVGVMLKGEYEFSTSSREYMTVITGIMKVRLQGESDFKEYKEGETFVIEKDNKFQLIIPEDCAYLCIYE